MQVFVDRIFYIPRKMYVVRAHSRTFQIIPSHRNGKATLVLGCSLVHSPEQFVLSVLEGP